MKTFFKKLKSGMLLCALLSILLGLILVLIPEMMETTLRYLLGGGLTLFGVAEVVFVFVRPDGLKSCSRMVPGVLCLAVGLVFLFRFDTFFALVWTLLGMAILIDAVYKLQYAFELKACFVSLWWVGLLTAILALIFAAVLILQPFAETRAMGILSGALVLANGVFDLLSVVLMSVYAKQRSTCATVLIQDTNAPSPKNALKKQ